ncbi:MAG: UDP-3-O-(3-hydroxymyristoyl)glucosamine N-acyltransferase [Parachlamydiales bacterium]
MAKKSFTLRELCELTGSTLKGNPEHIILNVADLYHATAEDVSFFSNPRYAGQLAKSHAGAVFVSQVPEELSQFNFLIHPDPSRAFQKVAETVAQSRPPLTGFDGIHPTAVIHSEAIIGENVTIGPYAVIDQKAIIGKGTYIGAQCYIGPETVIGENCKIHPRVTIREGCEIGNHVVLQPGVVIGSCGFGFTTSAQGEHTKLEQIGNVIIEDDVEIGANTTVDRSRFKCTRIGTGSKIDNLVMIGHGVEIGKHVLLVAQTGVAGSTTIGDHCTIAGQVAIAGHLKIGPKTRIAGKSGVSKSLPTGDYSGIPVQPIQEYNKNAVYLRKMSEFVEELKQLKQKILQES